MIRRTLAFLLIGLAIASSAWAKVPKDVAWEKYISSYKKLQVAFHDLVRIHQPELTETVNQSLELGLLIMDEKSKQFYYLLEDGQDRIIRNAGFRSFINFPWFEEDTKILRKKDREYRKIQKRIKELKEETEKNPDFPKIQEELRGMETDQRYMDVVARFRFVSEEVEKLLAEQQVG